MFEWETQSLYPIVIAVGTITGIFLLFSSVFVASAYSQATDRTVVEYDSLSDGAKQEITETVRADTDWYLVKDHEEEFSKPQIGKEIPALVDRSEPVFLLHQGNLYRLRLSELHQHSKTVVQTKEIQREEVPDPSWIKDIENVSHRDGIERAINKGYWEIHAHDTVDSGEDDVWSDHQHPTRSQQIYVQYKDGYYVVNKTHKESINGYVLNVEPTQNNDVISDIRLYRHLGMVMGFLIVGVSYYGLRRSWHN